MSCVFDCVYDDGIVRHWKRVPVEECSSDFLTIEEAYKKAEKAGWSISEKYPCASDSIQIDCPESVEEFWHLVTSADIEKAIEEEMKYRKQSHVDEEEKSRVVPTQDNIRHIIENQEPDVRERLNYPYLDMEILSDLVEVDFKALKAVLAKCKQQLSRTGKRTVIVPIDLTVNPEHMIRGNELREVVSNLLRDTNYMLRGDRLCFRPTKKKKTDVIKEKYGMDKGQLENILYYYVRNSAEIIFKDIGVEGEIRQPSNPDVQLAMRAKMKRMKKSDQAVWKASKKSVYTSLYNICKPNDIKTAFQYLNDKIKEQKEKEKAEKQKAA